MYTRSQHDAMLRPGWESLLTSYPPGEAEVYESEAGVGIGFAFEVGARGPAEGGGAGPRAPRKIRSP